MHPWQGFWRHENGPLDSNSRLKTIHHANNPLLEQQQEYLWGSGAPTKSLGPIATSPSNPGTIGTDKDNYYEQRVKNVTESMRIDQNVIPGAEKNDTIRYPDGNSSNQSRCNSATLTTNDNDKIGQLMIDSTHNETRGSLKHFKPIEDATRNDSSAKTNKSARDDNRDEPLSHLTPRECPVDALDQLISSTIGDITIYAEKLSCEDVEPRSDHGGDKIKMR